ncbi:MAG TPA: hypothetical protein DDW21_04015 [Verrucomicrobiales bacterium]|nr:MAG: hypothetical protein B9S37_06540 [Verrucomicrobiae bacterium Tous-C3TDCM]PAZ04658.1 MAG: hypothetical protein CAK88_10990 [Verrucomicrobiae bacterium AMD-G2]HBE22607.1 hypothetical protein [Verrucomicrobiales bacterium]
MPITKGVRSVSGKPNLHVPARMGILSSARFPMHSLSSDDLNFCNNLTFHQLFQSIPMSIVGVVINSTICCITSKQVASPLLYFSLGIVNPESHKTQAQLDAVMIDARTGFIYGAVGDTGTSYGVALTLLESEFVKQSGKSRATDSARKKLVKRFPAFLGERQSSARALRNFRNVAHFLLATKQ